MASKTKGKSAVAAAAPAAAAAAAPATDNVAGTCLVGFFRFGTFLL